MKRGQDTLMPNWALEALEALSLASDMKLLIWLTRHRAYRQNTYSTKQLAIALELDVRTVREGLARLRENDLILSFEGQHCSVEAAAKMPASYAKAVARLHSQTASAAQASRKGDASPLQIYPAQNPENAVPDEENQPLNKGTDELMKASYASGEQDGQTAGGQAEKETEYGAAPEFHSTPDLLSQEEPETVNLEGEAEAGLSPSLSPVPQPPFPSPVAPSAADAAALLFHDLAGYNFVSSHRASLERWSAAYSPAFLRLAYRLAPGLAGVRVGQHAFAWLLNREREWPEELKAQYQRDLQPAAVSVPLTIIVQPGDVLRWPDGRTATVERVDNADAVTDAPDDERGYVPLAVIGRSVQVVRA